MLDNHFTEAAARQLDLPSNEGALVRSVVKGSAAEKAGLQVGDAIVEFDGTHIKNDGHLVETVDRTPIGKRVTMLIHRQKSRLLIQIVTEPSPE